jgi:hypothetical protein
MSVGGSLANTVRFVVSTWRHTTQTRQRTTKRHREEGVSNQSAQRRALALVFSGVV